MFNKPSISKKIRGRRLSWIGYTQRMNESDGKVVGGVKSKEETKK